jgi:hypothetical protein
VAIWLCHCCRDSDHAADDKNYDTDTHKDKDTNKDSGKESDKDPNNFKDNLDKNSIMIIFFTHSDPTYPPASPPTLPFCP